MAEDNNTSEPTIDDLKAKLAELESSKTDDKNFEIRFNKSQEKVTELTDSLRGLTSTINDMEKSNKAAELSVAEKSGDFKSIVELKDRELSDLQSELLTSKLDVSRLIIGRKNNLPDEIARLLPGDDSDQIEANAITVRASMKTSTGFSDARQSGGVIVTGSGKKQPKSQYIPVRPDGAF